MTRCLMVMDPSVDLVEWLFLNCPPLDSQADNSPDTFIMEPHSQIQSLNSWLAGAQYSQKPDICCLLKSDMF